MSTATQVQAIMCDKTKLGLKYLETWQAGTVVPTMKGSSDWTVCKNMYGMAVESCCEPTMLKMSFMKLAQTVKMSWDKFLGDVSKFRMSAAKIKAAAGGSDAMNKAEMYKDRLMGLTGAQAQAIVNRLDAVSDYIGMLKDKASGCFMAANVARTNILCAACQNSDQIMESMTYPGDIVFKYKAGSCNALVEACYPVWDYMLKMQAQVLIAHEIKRGSGGSATKGTPKLPGTMTYGALYTINAKCTTGKVVASMCEQADIDNICHANLNFHAPEPIGMGVNTDDFNMASARLLAATVNGGTGTVTMSGGIDLMAETMAIDTTTMIDASKVGDMTSNGNMNNNQSSGNILMLSLVGMIAAAVAY